MVGNPEDQFSHNEAHLTKKEKVLMSWLKNIDFLLFYWLLVFAARQVVLSFDQVGNHKDRLSLKEADNLPSSSLERSWFQIVVICKQHHIWSHVFLIL